MKQRNYILDFIKLLFAIIIAISHFGYPVLVGGLVVDCFFVISGYFLIKSFDSQKYKSSFEYTKNRIKKIFPYYICALIIILGYNVCHDFLTGMELKSIGLKVINILPELFFIQNIGIFDGGLNYPLWQLSTLIVASYILFSMVSHNKKLTTNVICPIIVILGCSYYSNVFNTNIVEYWQLIFGIIPSPLFRAFTYLCLGAALTELLDYASEKVKTYPKWIIYTSFIFLILCFCVTDEFHALLSFIIIFMITLTNTILPKIFNHKVFKICEKLSLSIYLNHAIVIYVFHHFIDKNNITIPILLLFIVVVTLYSYIFYKIIDFVISKTKKS